MSGGGGAGALYSEASLNICLGWVPVQWGVGGGQGRAEMESPYVLWFN